MKIIGYDVQIREGARILLSQPLPHEYLNHHANAFEPVGKCHGSSVPTSTLVCDENPATYTRASSLMIEATLLR